MFTLANDQVSVSVLDPVADQWRFGPRYCTGGYIFQVEDARYGALMSGPTYPDDFNWFDGQGIPDAFNLGPLRDPNEAAGTALIIGIGVCDPEARQVRSFCDWEIDRQPGAISMRTTQRFGSFALDLVRTVMLDHRTVRSTTELTNHGQQLLPMRWFPHPFYPHPATDELCRLNFEIQLPPDGAYELAENGFIRRKGWPWSEGHFQALDHAGQAPLTVLQRHPLVGLVAGTCSYVPGFFPIWGNGRTFSWEPYLERTIGPDQSLTWWIDYDF